MAITDDAADAPTVEDVRTLLDAFKPLLQEVGAREAIKDRWPEVGDRVFWSHDQLGQHYPTSDYGMQQWDENFAWLPERECVAPRAALDSGQFTEVWNSGWNGASTRFSALRERYIEAMSPDCLDGAAGTAAGMLEVKSLMSQMHRQHDESGGHYQGEGQVTYAPGGFEKIEGLFESWEGQDGDAAWNAFGNVRQVVGVQRILVEDLADFVAAEAVLQINVRTTLLSELGRLAESVEAALADYDHLFLNLFNWAGVTSGTVGSGSGLADALERAFPGDHGIREDYDGEAPDKGWFTRFKEALLVEIEGSLDSKDAEDIFAVLEEIVTTTETMIDTSRRELQGGITDSSEYLLSQPLVQGDS